jgi:hypothetical protein
MIVVLVVVLVFVVLFILRKATCYGAAPNVFDINLLSAQLRPSPSKKAGVLVHMFTIDQATALNNNAKFEINTSDEFLTDCSATFRKTCSAWTYLRTDLLPVIFNKPTTDLTGPVALYGTPICGIILDPDKVESLITNMGTIDSNTDVRICCTGNGTEVWNAFKCDKEAKVGAVSEGFKGYGYDLPSTTHDVCNRYCPDNDDKCKMMNSGGGVNVNSLGCWGCKENNILGDWGCSACTGEQPPDTWPENDCSLCTYVNKCSLQETGPGQLPTSPNTWAPYFLDKENKIAGNYVGANGEKINKAFLVPDGLLHSWEGVKKVCKFSVQDWNAWISSVRNYYKAWYDNYIPSPLHLKTISGNPKNNNIMLSNPDALNYLENEVNLYMFPKESSFAAAQSELFRDAVLGVFYVEKTCLNTLKSLDGVQTSFSWLNNDTPQVYSTARERCIGFACGKTPSAPCVTDIVEGEQSYIDHAAAAMVKFADKFNTTYRVNKQHIKVFKFTGQSNTYYDYNALHTLMQNKELDPSVFFVDASHSELLLLSQAQESSGRKLNLSKVWPVIKKFGPS